MEFNPNKCQILRITRSRKPLQSQYTFHGQVFETVSDAKYFGITISKDLNWNIQVNNITTLPNMFCLHAEKGSTLKGMTI